MPNTDFIVGLKNGDPVVFRELIDQYQVPLMRLCKGFLHNEEDAKDIVQETFIEVFESVHRFREDARLSTWLYRIAVNKSLNLIRKNKMTRWFSRLDLPFTHAPDSLHDLIDEQAEKPGLRLENYEKYRKIKEAIDSLPNNQRIAFILNKQLELSYKEITGVMGISLSSVESLLHRARINLQNRLIKLYKKNLL